MAKYITDIQVSLNEAEEVQLKKYGYKKIPFDLGALKIHIFLWFKTGDCNPITRIQFSFKDKQDQGLIDTGYEKVNKNLNIAAGGSPIYLWFFKGTTEYDVPIVELDVSPDVAGDAAKLQPQWERSAFNLNHKGGGNQVHLWMKREKQTYICDITATCDPAHDAGMFKEGYIRLDEDTSRGAGGDYVFVWYRQTTESQKAVRDLQVSTNQEDEDSYRIQGYNQVMTRLNGGIQGPKVFLWYKKDNISQGPIKMVTLLSKQSARPFRDTGAEVIEKNIHPESNCIADYLCYSRI